MADVFISYTREDLPQVSTLAQKLKQLDLTVWWDAEIRAGARFAQVILKQLNSARLVFVVWSKHSIMSAFVEDEARRALEAYKLSQLCTRDLNIKQIPLGFGAFQVIPLDDIAGIAKATSPDRHNQILRLALEQEMRTGKRPSPQELVGDSANPTKFRNAVKG